MKLLTRLQPCTHFFAKWITCWIYARSCMLSHSSLTWPVQRSGLKEVIERNKANLDFPAVIFCHWTKPEKLEDRKTSEVSKFGGVGKSCFFFLCKALERLIGWFNYEAINSGQFAQIIDSSPYFPERFGDFSCLRFPFKENKKCYLM